MNTVIITGASSGIGLATAERFITEAYQVINISRRKTDNPQIIDIPCDLEQETAVTQAITQLLPYISKAGQVCLVHNACKISSDAADNGDIDDLKASLAINIVAPSIINRHLLPLLPHSSSVIYIGSTLSEKAVANAYSYIVSKHAMIGMMRSTCQDMAGQGIHTACICPGFTNTEMLRSHIPDQAVRLQIGSNNALQRLVEPNEIAELIWQAHKSPVINGSIIHANLGQLER